jgi:hypothetical protein
VFLGDLPLDRPVGARRAGTARRLARFNLKRATST